MAERPRLNLSAFERDLRVSYGRDRDRVEAERAALVNRVFRVATWWIDSWDLPAPGSRADINAARLLERLDLARVVSLVSAALPEISESRTPYRFESVVTLDGWVRICARAGASLEAYLEARRMSPQLFLTALEAVLQQPKALAGVAIRFVPDAGPLFAAAIRSDNRLPPFPKIAQEIAGRLLKGDEPDPVRRRLAEWARSALNLSSLSRSSEELALLRATIDASLVDEFLSDADLPVLLNWQKNGLIGRAASAAPNVLVSALRPFWRERVDWDSARSEVTKVLASALSGAPAQMLEGLAAEVGFEASRFQKEYPSADAEQILQRYVGNVSADVKPPFPCVLLHQVRLWSLLRRLTEYDKWGDPPEARGVKRDLMEFADAQPEAWALALPYLLPRVKDVPSIEVLTLMLAHQSEIVRAAVQGEAMRGATALIQDRAKGILATLDGFANPGVEFAETLLTFAARQLDGTPIFPHPLGMRGSTWIADPTAETLLRDGIERAAMRFAEYFRDQGAVDEEAVTAQLLAELEFAFRATEARARHVTAAARVPIGLVERRQVPKDEEDQIGCDLALIVRADVRGAISAAWAEFVQVKKPERRGTQFFDRWRITLETQLDDLLRTSPTSCYWLIGAAGEVFAIPAKLLLGIKRGRGSTGKTMNVSYREVRSAAIPLSQFILDVLAGAWIGSMDDGVVRVARGEDRGFRPREVFEITLHIGQRG